jgi:hypothetical protein
MQESMGSISVVGSRVIGRSIRAKDNLTSMRDSFILKSRNYHYRECRSPRHARVLPCMEGWSLCDAFQDELSGVSQYETILSPHDNILRAKWRSEPSRQRSLEIYCECPSWCDFEGPSVSKHNKKSNLIMDFGLFGVPSKTSCLKCHNPRQLYRCTIMSNVLSGGVNLLASTL